VSGRGDIGTTSVIIPALNEERLLGSLLSDVAAQTRKPDEVIVVDAGSEDRTVSVARRFPFVTLLEATRPVAHGRNAGGQAASGDVMVFLDADARLSEGFLEAFLADFERRELDVACPLYYPHDSTPAVERFHDLFNLLIRATQGVMPSGAGSCMVVRSDLFRASDGFDPTLKFDDIEMIRRLSRGRRFGIVEHKLFLSDRRYRESGFARTVAQTSLMGLFFALGKYHWANAMDYEIGKHDG
jgi:glycosyltransferase involved in cell wall biosynthesis